MYGLMKPNLSSAQTEIEKLCVRGKPATTHHSSHSIITIKRVDDSIVMMWVRLEATQFDSDFCAKQQYCHISTGTPSDEAVMVLSAVLKGWSWYMVTGSCVPTSVRTENL